MKKHLCMDFNCNSRALVIDGKGKLLCGWCYRASLIDGEPFSVVGEIERMGAAYARTFN